MDKGKNEVLLEELPVILEELFKIIYKIIDDTDDVEEIIKNEAVKDVDLTELIQITDQQIAEYINEKICDKEKNDLVFKVFQKLKINQSIEEIRVGNCNERIHFQKGCFLRVEHRDTLDRMFEKYTKIAIIDKDCKENILKELFKLGITFENIYPDKDNMVRTIKFIKEHM